MRCVSQARPRRSWCCWCVLYVPGSSGRLLLRYARLPAGGPLTNGAAAAGRVGRDQLCVARSYAGTEAAIVSPCSIEFR
jgi:hypothetical protein